MLILLRDSTPRCGHPLGPRIHLPDVHQMSEALAHLSKGLKWPETMACRRPRDHRIMPHESLMRSDGYCESCASQ